MREEWIGHGEVMDVLSFVFFAVCCSGVMTLTPSSFEDDCVVATTFVERWNLTDIMISLLECIFLGFRFIGRRQEDPSPEDIRPCSYCEGVWM